MKLFLNIQISSKIFDTRWEEALFSARKLPNDSILENLYKMRIGESDHSKQY